MTYSIIKLSQLEGAHRLDAEYYQPEYLDLEKKLDAVQTRTLGEVSKSVVSFGAYSLTSFIEWQESGVPYVNVANIHDGCIDTSDIKHISHEVDEILKKSRVQNGQVLLTMAGTIGSAAVAHHLEHHMNANQAIAKITPSEVSPYFLAAFLNSRYGRLQTLREVVSSVQANIFLGPIKKFRVPIFDAPVMLEIAQTYKDYLEMIESAHDLYRQAEQMLLEELGLEDVEKKDEPLTWTTRFSEAQNVHRCDAEYFQPKYERVLKAMNGHVDAVPLGTLVSIAKGTEPGSDAYVEEGVPFIRVSSISKFGIGDRDQKYLSAEVYGDLQKKFQPKVGEVLLTKDATPGVAYAVKEPVEGVVSGGVLRLTVQQNQIDPEFLVLCINSVVGQSQVVRDGGGSIIAHWRPEQVQAMKIPMLPKVKQLKLADLVRKSHAARRRADELFAQAKREVEEAIDTA